MCGAFFFQSDMIKVPAGRFCIDDCMFRWLREKQGKEHAVKLRKASTALRNEKKAVKKKDKARLRELRTRTAWYADLQKLVNQYVLHVRDKNDGCCTCGTTNPNIKYDAGHFHTRKARPDIRFELTNIAKQCSQQCNVYGSGMRNEFEKFISEKYGPDHVDWLKQVKPPLKEQFPNWQDIDAEIIRYRKLLRELGIKPHV